MEKKVAQNFIIYSLPDMLAKGIYFIILPIITLYLSKEDFGYIALFTLCSIPFSILVQFGAGYVINSTWYRFDKEQRKELLFNLLFISAILNVLAIIVITVFHNKIFPLIVGKNWDILKSLYWALLLKVIFDIPSEIFRCWVIIEQRAKLSSIVQILNLVLTASSTVVLAILTRDFKCVILSNVAVSVIMGVIEVIVMRSSLKFRLRYEYFKLTYNIGSPIFLRSIFNQIRKQIDTFLMARFFDAGQFAIYVFPKKVDAAFSAITTNYEKSFEPYIYKQLAENNLLLPNLRRVLFFEFYSIFVISCVLFLFGQQLINLLTNNIFASAYPLLLLMLCIVIVKTPFTGIPSILIYYQKTKYIFWSTMVQGVFSIFLCFILIKLYGAKGGIVALWGGTFVYFFLYYLEKRKLYPEPFIEKITLPYVLVFHLLVILKVYFDLDSSRIMIFATAIILTIHGVFRERKYLRSLFEKGMKKLSSKSTDKFNDRAKP